MTFWKDKIVLESGCSLQYKKLRTNGFMQEADIEEYDIVNASGEIIGAVVVTDHTAVRGFRRTVSVKQRDRLGRVLVDESWNV